jgi:two-component system CheB/CheR fusion protein
MTSGQDDDLPYRDDAGYLLLDEEWRVLAVSDASAFAGEGEKALAGQHAEAIIGADALAYLRARRVAVFTLDAVDYVLSATSFETPSGALRLVRVQEVEATLEHVVSLLVHEIRNPLSAMRTLAQGLEEVLRSEPATAAYTSRLTGEIDRLSRLLASMAQVARLRARSPELLAPAEVLERAAAIFRPELARRGIRIEVQIKPRIVPFYGDSDQIQQLLVNLITNAADAMPDGGVITLHARPDARGRSMLQVEDTGVGMSGEVLERVLRPRNSSKAGGMGLGLLIARGIVRQHGGHMRMTSAPGKGTTATITFPHPDTTGSRGD